MEAQQDFPPHAEGTASGDPQEQLSPTSPMDAEGEHGHKKKSVIGKVKDKAKRLKTKMKLGGSGDNTDSSSAASSNEEETGSDLHQKAGEERDEVVTPGLKGEAYEAIPDPHTDAATGVGEKYEQMQPEGKPEITTPNEKAPPVTDVVTPGLKGEAYEAIPDPHTDTAADVGEKLGELKLADDPEAAMRNEEVPAALDQPSADIGQGTEASRDTPVEEGKNVEADDASGKPSASEKDSTKDHIVERAAAAAATSAAGMGLKSHDDTENVEATDRDENETRTESKPSMTSRAADTVAGLKNTIASKLGYSSSTTPGVKPPADTPESIPQTAGNKSVLQKLQESAAGATAAVSSRLGYGSQKGTSDQTEADGVAALGGDGKPYTQKVKETAFDTKDAVAARLPHGVTATEGDPASGASDKSYLQRAREAAIGAKDAVTAKIGYGATDEQNTPTSAAPARFHPGEEDEALSHLITEKMSSGAATVKDTLMRPFSAATSKGGPPTRTTTPPPSSAAAVESDPANTLVDNEPSEEKPGIVGKVTGAVSSLLSTSASGKKRADESAAKATEDPQAQAAGA